MIDVSHTKVLNKLFPCGTYFKILGIVQQTDHKFAVSFSLNIIIFKFNFQQMWGKINHDELAKMYACNHVQSVEVHAAYSRNEILVHQLLVDSSLCFSFEGTRLWRKTVIKWSKKQNFFSTRRSPVPEWRWEFETWNGWSDPCRNSPGHAWSVKLTFDLTYLPSLLLIPWGSVSRG